MTGEDPVAIVTGAGRGLGRAISLQLAEHGFALGLVARSAGELESVRSEVSAAGRRAVVVACDVRDTASVDEAVARVGRELGPVEALVNNAGSWRAVGPLWTIDPADWWGDVETSLGGAFGFCRAVLPGMVERGAGRVVNVASYAAVRPAPYQSGYACGKAALVCLTESLAAELRPHGVTVFAVSPGFAETALTRRARASAEGRRWLPELAGRTPLPVETGAGLVSALVCGQADVLTGRFLHALDDLDDLVRRAGEVEAGDCYVPRLRTLPREAV